MEEIRKEKHMVVKRMVKEGRDIEAFNKFIKNDTSLQRDIERLQSMDKVEKNGDASHAGGDDVPLEMTISLSSISVLLRAFADNGSHWAECGYLLNAVIRLYLTMVKQRGTGHGKDQHQGGMVSDKFLFKTFQSVVEKLFSLPLRQEEQQRQLREAAAAADHYDQAIVSDIVSAYVQLLAAENGSTYLRDSAARLLDQMSSWLVRLHQHGHLTDSQLEKFSSDIFRQYDTRWLQHISTRSRHDNTYISSVLTSALKRNVGTNALSVLHRLHTSKSMPVDAIDILKELTHQGQIDLVIHILKDFKWVISADNMVELLYVYLSAIACCIRGQEREPNPIDAIGDSGSITSDPWHDIPWHSVNWLIKDAAKKGIKVTSLTNAFASQFTTEQAYRLYANALHEITDPRAGYILQYEFPSLSSFIWKIRHHLSTDEIRRQLVSMWPPFDKDILLTNRGYEGMLLLFLVKMSHEHSPVLNLLHSLDDICSELNLTNSKRFWAFGLFLKAFLCERPSGEELNDLLKLTRLRYEEKRDIAKLLPSTPTSNREIITSSQVVQSMLSIIDHIGVMPPTGRPLADLYKTLLYHIAQEGNTNHVHNVLKNLRSRGVKVEGSIANSILSGFAKGGHLRQLMLFKTALESQYGFRPLDLQCYGVIIHALVLAGEYSTLHDTLKDMIVHEVNVDTAMINSIIHGLCKNDDEEKAFSILRNMTSSDITPDAISFHPILQAYIHKGRTKEVFDMMNWMSNCGVKLNRYFMTSLFESLAEKGNIDHAVSLMDNWETHESEMKKEEMFGRFLLACVRHSHEQAFDKIVEKMHKANITPSTSIYSSVIYRKAKKGQHQDALDKLEEMKRLNIPRDPETYSFLISELAFQKAYDCASNQLLAMVDDIGLGKSIPVLIDLVAMLDIEHILFVLDQVLSQSKTSGISGSILASQIHQRYAKIRTEEMAGQLHQELQGRWDM